MASLGVWCSSPCPQWRTAVLWSSGVNIPSRAHAWTDPVEGEFSYLSRFRLGETLWSQSLINKHILADHSKAQRVFGKYKLWTHSCIFFLLENILDRASFKLLILIHDRLVVWMPARQLCMRNLLAVFLASSHQLQGRLSPPHPCRNQSSMNMEYWAMLRWVDCLLLLYLLTFCVKYRYSWVASGRNTHFTLLFKWHNLKSAKKPRKNR